MLSIIYLLLSQYLKLKNAPARCIPISSPVVGNWRNHEKYWHLCNSILGNYDHIDSSFRLVETSLAPPIPPLCATVRMQHGELYGRELSSSSFREL